MEIKMDMFTKKNGCHITPNFTNELLRCEISQKTAKKRFWTPGPPKIGYFLKKSKSKVIYCAHFTPNDSC